MNWTCRPCDGSHFEPIRRITVLRSRKLTLFFHTLIFSVVTTLAPASDLGSEPQSDSWTEEQLSIAQKLTGLSNDSLSLLLEDGSPLAGKLNDTLAAVAVVNDLSAARDLSALASTRDVVLDKLITEFANAKEFGRFVTLLTAFKVYKASLEIVHDHWWTPAMEEDIYTRYKTHRPHNATWQKRETLMQATGSKYHDLRDDWYDKLVKEKGYDKTVIGPELEEKLRNTLDNYWMSYLEARYQREALLEEMKQNKQSLLETLLRRQSEEFSYMLVVQAVDAQTGKPIARFNVEADSDKGKESVGAGRNGTAVLSYRGSSKYEHGDARLHYGVWEITVSADGHEPITTACLHSPGRLTVCTVRLGSGLQRVLVKYTVTTSEETSPGSFRWKGSCQAIASFRDDAVVLDFDAATAKVEGAPDNMDESDLVKVEEDKTVWTGKIADDDNATIEGKTKHRSTWRETRAPNNVGYARTDGTFSARMSGNALIGTAETKGVTKSTRTGESTIKHTYSFHIDDFPVPEKAGR